MQTAKKDLIIIDGYADKTVLDMISNLSIKVTLIVKTKSLIKDLDIKKYREQYDNLHLIYDDSFHDRYIILDRKEVYHCGASLNHAGNRTFSVNILEDKFVKENLIRNVEKLIERCLKCS
ncbi:MAG TPA: hypothetical protein DCY94_04870 [Firmicutes bacterium]|nr:hypothetical protein [Bacillota bacterium]